MLRECLYRGADRAIMLTDRRAAASDTLATSYIIAQAVKAIGETFGAFDFVFCGRQAIDGDTAQVGPQTAEKLGIPQITYAEQVVDIADGAATIRRHIDGGSAVYQRAKPGTASLSAAFDVRPRPIPPRRPSPARARR